MVRSHSPKGQKGNPYVKSILRIAVGLSLLVGGLVFSAAPVAASSYGDCGNRQGENLLAGEEFTHESNQTLQWGVAGRIFLPVDGATFEECTGSVIADPYGSLAMYGILANGNIGGITAGVAECDNTPISTIPFCTGSPRLFIHAVTCDILHIDMQYDYGAWAPGTSKDIELKFNSTTHWWEVRIDGVLKRSFDGDSPAFQCVNPANQVYGSAVGQAQRWNLGDGWGSSSNPVVLYEMDQMKTLAGGWVAAGVDNTVNGGVCDFNNRNFTPHKQYCRPDLDGRDKIEFYTVY